MGKSCVRCIPQGDDVETIFPIYISFVISVFFFQTMIEVSDMHSRFKAAVLLVVCQTMKRNRLMLHYE